HQDYPAGISGSPAWLEYTAMVAMTEQETRQAPVLLNYPACKGRHVFCGMRQSIPSSSMVSWDALRLTLPSFAAGQTKRPRSSRLENRHAPWASHQMIFNRSPRRPRNTNRWPEYGSSARTFSACAASVLNPRRISVTPAASQTRV